MTYPKKHLRQTKKLLSKVGAKKAVDWLLTQGYFPEQFVLPPCFYVSNHELQKKPYYPISKKGFHPPVTQLVSLFLQKSQLTDRSYSIMDPKIYHDLCFYIKKDWKLIVDTLFNKENKIYSYSFPIPISSKVESHVGQLRAGRMVYEFIEMAENDLVAEAYNFRYILRTDIKNFYPSIYTHSISWALHGKEGARKDRNKYSLIGNKIDKLCQNANDGCTNGIAIGPALTDLISEIVLSAIDVEVSRCLQKKRIKWLGVRFKDDYRVLCKTKADGEFIIKVLQAELRKYNLNLGENKSDLIDLPEGLYRNWISDYSKYTLRYKEKINFRVFEKTYLSVLKLDRINPDTGVIDRFLSELSSKHHNLKLQLKGKEVQKAISLLLLLRTKRPKSFPQILAIIEKLYIQTKEDRIARTYIKRTIREMLIDNLKNPVDNIFVLIWLSYFVQTNSLFKIKWPKKIENSLLNSIKYNNQEFFKGLSIDLFQKIKGNPDTSLLKHLSLFPKASK